MIDLQPTLPPAQQPEACARVPNVCAVVVCYRPDPAKLQQLCDAVRADGVDIVLVDNTEHAHAADRQRPAGCRLIALGTNTGIAHAQNVGIADALENGAQAIAFFDQDSTIEPGFLGALLAPLALGRPDVVSPLYFDDVSHTALPSVRVNRCGLPHTIHVANAAVPYEVDVVISSGTVATREVFEVAGTLDERLFIDFVDTEWCLRCRSKQVPIRVVPGAVMRHRIGSASIKAGLTTVSVHSPVRCYYQLRNCFHLFRRRHVPLLFATRETLAVFFSRALLLIFVSNRSAYLKAYVCGIRDGLLGVYGSKPA